MRKTTKVKCWGDYGDCYDVVDMDIITKAEYERFPPKIIYNNRPHGISGYAADEYVIVNVGPNNVCKIQSGAYAIRAGDLKEILSTLPHYPNKQEAKEIRRAAAKKGR